VVTVPVMLFVCMALPRLVEVKSSGGPTSLKGIQIGEIFVATRNLIVKASRFRPK
jgi:hypothetical protein